MFTHHIDTGDYVIIINAAKVQVTGNKMWTKKYYHHSGHPGGLKEATMEEKMAKDPTHAIWHAVRGMLPVNKLRDGRLDRLKIYADAEHAHEAQKPEVISVKEAK
jgi:large subunit ribosomal protein L13